MMDGKIKEQIPSVTFRVVIMLGMEVDGPNDPLPNPHSLNPVAEVSYFPLLISFSYGFQSQENLKKDMKEKHLSSRFELNADAFVNAGVHNT